MILERGHKKQDCGKCYQCCATPFLMTCSDLEAEIIFRYIRENNLPLNLHFEVLEDEEKDKRLPFDFWVCPLYDPVKVRCLVYEVRPFSCRVVGPFRSAPELLPACSYKNPFIYETPLDIPGWDKYSAILRQYDFKRGYIFPDDVL